MFMQDGGGPSQPLHCVFGRRLWVIDACECLYVFVVVRLYIYERGMSTSVHAINI